MPSRNEIKGSAAYFHKATEALHLSRGEQGSWTPSAVSGSGSGASGQGLVNMTRHGLHGTAWASVYGLRVVTRQARTPQQNSGVEMVFPPVLCFTPSPSLAPCQTGHLPWLTCLLHAPLGPPVI